MGKMHAWGKFALIALGCVVATVGCEGKQRDFVSLEEARGESRGDSGAIVPVGAAIGSGEGSPGIAGGVSGAPPVAETIQLSALGEACASSGTCASNFCVDGVCCDGACTDLCATCAASGSEGTCSPAPSDVACNGIACPGSTECRGRDQTGLALNCEAVGQCRVAASCEPLDAPEGSPCQTGAGACDGLGACNVPGKASLGEACVGNEDCAEGHCVQGADGASLCCDAACDGACQQCSAAGRCDQFPAHDEACIAVTCPVDNVCFDFPETLTDGLCRGFGQCKGPQDCPGTSLRPATSCDCDVERSCSLSRGTTCTDAAQCGADACVPTAAGGSVCCAQTCGTGLFCASDGSGCVECEGDDVLCNGGTSVRCEGSLNVSEPCANGCTDGVGCNTLAPVGFSCAAAECVTGAVCQVDVSGVSRCCARDCAADDKQCAVDGSCVCPPGQAPGAANDCLLEQGDPCGTGAAQCGAGLTCVDGVCCDAGCNGACESCNINGSVGTCSFNARDTAGCAAGEQCVARGDCRADLGQSCAVAGDCLSGNCEPLLGVSGSSICCASGCEGQSAFCSTAGDRCVQCQSNADCTNGCNLAQGTCNPLRPLGQTCSVASQCGSGVCLPDADDGQLNRCCPRCAAGQLCAADGACHDPPQGAGGSCQSDAQCGGGLFCRDNVCCTSQCNGACQACGGNGVCNSVPATDAACPPANCGQSTECRIVTAPAAAACSALGQCAQCQTRNATTGTDCGADGDCNNQGECQPNRVAPSVIAGSLRGDPVGLSSVSLFITPASDDRTPAASLEYAVVQALTDILDDAPAGLVAAAEAGGPIQLLRPFATGTNFGTLALPSRAPVHFVRVLVRDGSGNLAAYNTAQVAFQDAASCNAAADCISGVCTSLFPDVDGDGFGAGLRAGGTCSGRATTGFAVNNTDCCDLPDVGEDFRPNQTAFFDNAVAACAHAGDPGGRDYNCSNTVDLEYPASMVCVATRCSVAQTERACDLVPACVNASAACGASIGLNIGCQFIAEASPPFCSSGASGPVVQGCR